MSDNGAHVTWRELNLVLEPLRNDVAEIKGDVKTLLGQQFLSARGRQLLTKGAVKILLALPIGGLTGALLTALLH